MEVTLSIFAWLGVVLLQALVHYLVVRTRKRGTVADDAPALEASPLVLERRSKESKQQVDGPPAPQPPRGGSDAEELEAKETGYADSAGDARVVKPAASRDSSIETSKTSTDGESDAENDHHSGDDIDSNSLCDDMDDSLDGDEPEEFFLLLSQTGCEMLKVSIRRVTLRRMNAWWR